MKLDYEEIVYLVDSFMSRTSSHRNLSKGFVKELQKVAKSKKPNLQIEVTKDLILEKANDKILFVDASKLSDYSLKMEKPGKLINDFLTIDFSKNFVDYSL